MNALVTGGARGIGRAVVDLLTEQGARVAILDLDPGDVPCALSVKCDVGDERGVVEAVGRVRDELGPLDLAVLNAGVGGMARVTDMTADEWDRVQRVNARGVFLTLRECAKAMAHPGAIVVVTSISAFLAERGMAHYAASKAAAAELVRVAARELGPKGIRVNAVAPGTTDTPLFASTSRLPGYADRVAARTALGGVGPARGVAEAIVALAGLEWVTGQVLAADGGLSLWSPIDPLE